jgi:hypothetical protein
LRQGALYCSGVQIAQICGHHEQRHHRSRDRAERRIRAHVGQAAGIVHRAGSAAIAFRVGGI